MWLFLLKNSDGLMLLMFGSQCGLDQGLVGLCVVVMKLLLLLIVVVIIQNILLWYVMVGVKMLCDIFRLLKFIWVGWLIMLLICVQCMRLMFLNIGMFGKQVKLELIRQNWFFVLMMFGLVWNLVRIGLWQYLVGSGVLKVVLWLMYLNYLKYIGGVGVVCSGVVVVDSSRNSVVISRCISGFLCW